MSTAQHSSEKGLRTSGPATISAETQSTPVSAAGTRSHQPDRPTSCNRLTCRGSWTIAINAPDITTTTSPSIRESVPKETMKAKTKEMSAAIPASATPNAYRGRPIRPRNIACHSISPSTPRTQFQPLAPFPVHDESTPPSASL